jgi:signal recognition particle GTPase
VQEVNRMLSEFQQMQGMMTKMMKRLGGMPGLPR